MLSTKTIVKSNSSNKLQSFKKKPDLVKTPSKKNLLDSYNEWKKDNLIVLAHDQRLRLAEMFAQAKAKQSSPKDSSQQDVLIGFNEINRAILRNEVAVLAIAQEAQPQIVKYLTEGAHLRKIPIVCVPRLSITLSGTFGVKSLQCFAIKKLQEGKGIEEETQAQMECDLIVDNIRDLVRTAAAAKK